MSCGQSDRDEGVFASTTFDHHLKHYSAAAVAAGVSVLALTLPAAAKVVTTTKTIFIPINQPVLIDLDHDGVADFEFSLISYSADCSPDFEFTMKPLAGGAVVGGPIRSSVGPYASALAQGAKIGPSAHFGASSGRGVAIEKSNFEYCSFSYNRSLIGHWGGNPRNRYLGVKFLIHGTTHYGWISLSSNYVNRKSIAAHINAFAYETVAGRRISAGSTSSNSSEDVASPATTGPSLGMLALGSDGLTLWRREENVS